MWQEAARQGHSYYWNLIGFLGKLLAPRSLVGMSGIQLQMKKGEAEKAHTYEYAIHYERRFQALTF